MFSHSSRKRETVQKRRRLRTQERGPLARPLGTAVAANAITMAYGFVLPTMRDTGGRHLGSIYPLDYFGVGYLLGSEIPYDASSSNETVIRRYSDCRSYLTLPAQRLTISLVEALYS